MSRSLAACEKNTELGTQGKLETMCIFGEKVTDRGKDETVAMCQPRNCNNVQMTTSRISQVDHC